MTGEEGEREKRREDKRRIEKDGGTRGTIDEYPEVVKSEK